MDNKVKVAIDRARAHLGRLPHPDWLVKVLGISQEEAREAIREETGEPAPAPDNSTLKPPLDLHRLPSHLVRFGLLGLAVLATMREFGYTLDYFGGLGGVIMALLISGGSTVLPQAVAILWPKRGAGFKLLGASAFILGLGVLVASTYITTSGMYRQQTETREAQTDQGAESQARELEAIIQGLERQIETKARDLETSRGRVLEGWALTLETRRGDAIAQELTDLETRLESRRLELSGTEAVIRVRGDFQQAAGEGVEIGMAVLMSAIISLVGPLALAASLWGGLDTPGDTSLKSRKRRK